MCDKIEFIPTNIVEILPENILDIDTKAVKCFLCNRDFINGDESFLIFNERMQSDGTRECPLAVILSAALDDAVEEATAHSSLLCSACNDVVLEFERVEHKLLEIRMHIIMAYNDTILRFKNTTSIENEEVLDNQVEEINTNDIGNLEQEDNLMQSLMKNDDLDQSIPCKIIEESVLDATSEETTSNSKFNEIIEQDQIFEELNNDCNSLNEVSNLLENEAYDSKSESYNISAYLCGICNYSEYLDAPAFSEHMLNEHQLRVSACDLCTSTFHNKEELREHIEQNHNTDYDQDIQYECDICQQCFNNYSAFRSHKRTHDDFPNYSCQECHKAFDNSELLQDHMKNSHGQGVSRPYQCQKCSKQFTTRRLLQAHVKIHGERERPHSCKECGKCFMTPQNLQHHMKIHTNEKLFVCEICTKSFSTKFNLDHHKIVHSGKRPFSCNTCGKSFARRSEIADHERIHTGDRPFKCDMCDLAFTQRSNLIAHKKTTHLKEKLHKCDTCDRSFKRRRLLDYHIQAVHTGERPYKCKECPSSFVYPEHFKKHQRIHTGDKPFACEVCDKRFTSCDNRNVHRFTHSDKKPYECMQCGSGFMRKQFLLAHMKSVKHISDTIIVNQPQISNGKLKTKTVTVNESAVEGIFEEYVEEDDHCEADSFDKILPNVSDVKDSSSLLSQANDSKYNEEDDMKYLTFADFDTATATVASHQSLTWSDLTEDKD